MKQIPRGHAKRARRTPLVKPIDATMEMGPQTGSALPTPITRLAPQPNLLIVVERRDFVRGCLTCWLDSSCGEFETLAVAAVETSLDDGNLARAAAVVVGVDTPEQADEWLGRQIAWLRAKCPNLPIIMIVELDETNAA
jgi:hypothetical protein